MKQCAFLQDPTVILVARFIGTVVLLGNAQSPSLSSSVVDGDLVREVHRRS